MDLEYGFGFPSFRGELKTIDTEAESEADRVAAQALIANTTYMHTRSRVRPLAGCGVGQIEDKKMENSGIGRHRYTIVVLSFLILLL